MKNTRYLRTKCFYRLLSPFSQWKRRQRMSSFCTFLSGIEIDSPRIIDLGGQPEIWSSVNRPLEIWIVNLPGVSIKEAQNTIHTFRYLQGNACSMTEFKDNTFDIVFSNSVIEHVGSAHYQQDFANEVRRLAKRYWIQTPSKYFPIEAHCGMPFWWFYSQSVKNFFLTKWEKKLPGWTKMVRGTRVLSKQRMMELFPDASLHIEKFFGFHKSYIVYK
ncbi:MAG: methyltransferase domain-containing protein [Candidatus Electrothrix sp. AW3_4]|nr:methyltransferase domain-containing protein [Candidatus Electrothrix gigas]